MEWSLEMASRCLQDYILPSWHTHYTLMILRRTSCLTNRHSRLSVCNNVTVGEKKREKKNRQYLLVYNHLMTVYTTNIREQ